MKIEQPNPTQRLLMFKKELWIRDYSVRMQKWFRGMKSAPLRVDAELHRRCNLECIQCHRRSSPVDMNEASIPKEVSDQRWFEIAEESGQIGVRAWNIAGVAEPMARPTLTLKMMEILKGQNIFGEITTNGTLWDEDAVRRVVKIRWDAINVSIDSPKAEVNDYLRAVPGTFEKATRTVRWFREHRDRAGFETPCITVNLVLNRRNYKDLPEMIRFCADIGADALFVEPMIVYTDLGQSIKLDRAQTRELPAIIEETKEVARKVNVIPFISCIEEDDETEVDEFKGDLVEKTSGIKDVIVNQSKDTEKLLDKYTVVEDPTKEAEARKERLFYTDKALEDQVIGIPCYYPWFYLMIMGDGTVVHCGECTDPQHNIKEIGLSDLWYGEYMERMRALYGEGELPSFCNRCRPNVVNDIQIVRKSILEYANVMNLQHEYVKVLGENEKLKNELYHATGGKMDAYRRGKLTPVSKARKIYGVLKS